jgi:Methyltransferase domain.
MEQHVHGVPLPPEDFVFMDADARQGYEMGKKLANSIGALGLNTTDGHLLDVGCGYGRLAYGLLGNGYRGDYLGLDLLPDRITFLKEKFESVHPNFRFRLLNVRNDAYIFEHPQLSKSRERVESAIETSATASAVNFGAYTRRQPDAIVLLSVFTHMFDEDILAYLRAFHEIMHAGSGLLFSAFIYDDSLDDRIRDGRAKAFRYYKRLSAHCITADPAKPLAMIANEKSWIEGALKALGFEFKLYNGNWSGLAGGNLQDWIVAKRMTT